MKLRHIGHKRRVVLSTVAIILFCLICFVQFAELFFLLADKITVFSPSYAKLSQEELTRILVKDELTDEDYDTLYMQTGLTKVGIDRELAASRSNYQRIFAIQDNFFGSFSVEPLHVGPFMCSDYLANSRTSTSVHIEAGDIVITTTTHLSGWRMGHSGVAISPYSLMEATSYGRDSHTVSITPFTRRANMIVLAPKKEYISTEQKLEIAEFLRTELLGIPYDITVGLFSPKDSIKSTQCSHLIWYAYNHFGFDIDSDKGMFVSPQDFLHSEYLEIVQVFGLDPIKLWE